MQRIQREIVAHAQLIRHFGPSGPFEIFESGWPVFDSLMAVAIYFDGRPYFISSVLADELGHDSRTEEIDEALPPQESLFDWAEDRFGEDSVPFYHSSGLWECYWLGEVDYPVPIATLSADELAAFPTTAREKLSLARALGGGGFTSHSKWLAVRDKSGPIEIAFELSELLGYSPRDHSWVPETWRTTQVPAGYTCLLYTSDAADE